MLFSKGIDSVVVACSLWLYFTLQESGERDFKLGYVVSKVSKIAYYMVHCLIKLNKMTRL